MSDAQLLPAGVHLSGQALWDVIATGRLLLRVAWERGIALPPRIRQLFGLLEAAGRVAANGNSHARGRGGLPSSGGDELLTIEQAAELLGCPLRTVRHRWAVGTYATARKLAGRWVLDRSEVATGRVG